MNENPTPPPENEVLSEKDFIQESRTKPPIPLWIWLAILALIISIFWGAFSWFDRTVKGEDAGKPLLEVTNRDFSVFLWQFPAFMRSFAPDKSNYLTGFQYIDKQTVDPKAAEDFVKAPPEILFLYYTWKRLLSEYYIPTSIPPKEFVEFLKQTEIWLPQNWKEAPNDYVLLINTKGYEKMESVGVPLVVKQAFQGWKNFAKEGAAINKINPTYGEVKKFLEEYPKYGRPYWRNIKFIEGREVAGDHYLESLQGETNDGDLVPKEQIAPFLKVALFNYLQSIK